MTHAAPVGECKRVQAGDASRGEPDGEEESEIEQDGEMWHVAVRELVPARNAHDGDGARRRFRTISNWTALDSVPLQTRTRTNISTSTLEARAGTSEGEEEARGEAQEERAGAGRAMTYIETGGRGKEGSELLDCCERE